MREYTPVSRQYKIKKIDTMNSNHFAVSIGYGKQRFQIVMACQV